MHNITIASLNARGLASNEKRKDVFSWLKDKQFSIYCLQDVHWVKENEPTYLADWGLNCVFNSYRGNSRGVAILFNDNFQYEIHNSFADQNGNYLILDITICDNRMTLINMYGPNQDQPQFFQDIYTVTQSIDNASIIWCGDWNLVMDYNKDTKNYSNRNNPRARQKVIDIMEASELTDIWRVNNPDTRRYTWHTKHSPFRKGRLDFFLITPDIHNRVVSTDIKTSLRSDHSLVSISLDFGLFKRGRGFWKFNTSLLHDHDYVQLVKQCIEHVLGIYRIPLHEDTGITEETFSIDYRTLFEMMKLEIRGKSISFSANKKRQTSKEENELENQINKLQKNIDENEDTVVPLIRGHLGARAKVSLHRRCPLIRGTYFFQNIMQVQKLIDLSIIN